MSNPSSGFRGDSLEAQNDLKLAKKAAAGDEAAREAVVRLLHPLIQRQTKTFCKRYCFEDHKEVRCTVEKEWARDTEEDALDCDLGHSSYAWMLEDLIKKLLIYKGSRDAKLSTYFYSIINSLPFYERWKDDRFKRRINIPTCIQDLSPLAEKIFRWMIDCHPVNMMAQKAKVSEEKIEEIADRIIGELTEEGKLYLLNASTHKKNLDTTSLTGFGQDKDDPESGHVMGDIPDESWDPAKDQLRLKIREGKNKLAPIEQSVLDEMVIEGRNAKDVLKSLVQNGMTIKEGVLPEEINLQQLFYFKRKTLAKLKRLSGL